MESLHGEGLEGLVHFGLDCDPVMLDRLRAVKSLGGGFTAGAECGLNELDQLVGSSLVCRRRLELLLNDHI